MIIPLAHSDCSDSVLLIETAPYEIPESTKLIISKYVRIHTNEDIKRTFGCKNMQASKKNYNSYGNASEQSKDQSVNIELTQQICSAIEEVSKAVKGQIRLKSLQDFIEELEAEL